MHSGPSLTTCRSHAIPEACKRAFPLSPLARDMAGLTAANATIAAANPKTLKHQHAQPCHLAPDHLRLRLPTTLQSRWKLLSRIPPGLVLYPPPCKSKIQLFDSTLASLDHHPQASSPQAPSHRSSAWIAPAANATTPKLPLCLGFSTLTRRTRPPAAPFIRSLPLHRHF